jgi:hypothetical protein
MSGGQDYESRFRYDQRMSPEAIFDWLIGDWTFTRVVTNQARITGHASLESTTADTALYAESAEVHLLTGEVLHAKQRYLYRRTRTGFDLLFPETVALFQSLHFTREPLGTLTAHSRHHCSTDTYQTTYTITADNSFKVHHLVTGPRKDHAIQTTYTRP